MAWGESVNSILLAKIKNKQATDHSPVIYRYTSIQANYLTIPVYAFGTICLVSAAYTSDRIKQRGLFAFFGPLSIGIGYAIFIGSTNTGAGYFALFLVAGGEHNHTHMARSLPFLY